MGLPNNLSCEAGSLSCCRPNPHGRFQSEVSGFIYRSWSPGLRGLLRSPPFVWFICVRMWGRRVLPTALPAPFSATLSPALSVYLCTGPQGLLVLGLPVLLVPHSASLGPATATRVLSTPVPVSAPPTGLDECLFFISLVLDFLAVQFSVSSGCARRRSVSTYATILVLPCYVILNQLWFVHLYYLLALVSIQVCEF